MIQAMVIRTAGDPALSGAIASGIAESAELRAARDELEAMRKQYTRMMVKEDRDRDYWRRKIARAQRHYGDNPKHCKAVSALIGAAGLIILIMATWARRLDEINREEK